MVSGEPLTPRAPRVFVDDDDALEGGRLTVRGSQLVHRLSRVLRLRRGDEIEVIHAPSARFYLARVERLSDERVEAAVIEERAVQPVPPPTLTLCPAVIRSQRFDIVVEKATELGATGIRPVRAERSMTQSGGRDRVARWRRIVTEAAEQCRREDRPQIEQPADVDAVLRELPSPGTLRIFASQHERRRRVEDLVREMPDVEHVQILVGPEGGFTPAEAQVALDHGWRPVTLGPRPLRAETASVVALALVQEAMQGGARG